MVLVQSCSADSGVGQFHVHLQSLTNESFHSLTRVCEGQSFSCAPPSHLTSCVLMSFELRCLGGERRGWLQLVFGYLQTNIINVSWLPLLCRCCCCFAGVLVRLPNQSFSFGHPTKEIGPCKIKPLSVRKMKFQKKTHAILFRPLYVPILIRTWNVCVMALEELL